MKPTPKTDLCIRLLENVIIIFSEPLYVSANGREKTEVIMEAIKRSRAILRYCIFPVEKITIDKINNGGKEAFFNFLSKYSTKVDDSELLWTILNEYEVITLNELKNEFWEVCPDIDDIPKYLKAFQTKYEKILHQFPDGQSYSIENIIKGEDHNKRTESIDALYKKGVIDKKEKEEILYGLHFIAEDINWKIDTIIDLYNGFKRMLSTEASQTFNTQNGDEDDSNNELTENDILLRSIFGSHLDNFLREAAKYEKGSKVANLVNWYVREYKLEKSTQLNKPLKEALEEKGISTASKATWNNIIQNR